MAGSAWARWATPREHCLRLRPAHLWLSKLSDLVRKTGAFDIDQPEGRAMRIRAKPKPPPKTRAKTATR